jgi:hypothetical protein
MLTLQTTQPNIAVLETGSMSMARMELLRRQPLCQPQQLQELDQTQPQLQLPPVVRRSIKPLAAGHSKAAGLKQPMAAHWEAKHMPPIR